MRIASPDREKTKMKRRWRIPPPLLQNGEGPGPEGLGILDEFRSELGIVLWKSLRSVLLWADTNPKDRHSLFSEGSDERRQIEILSSVPDDEESLREALEDLLAVLARPVEVDPEFVGVACNRVAAWAEGRKALRTSLEFLQGAALACPADPGFAMAVGRATRNLAEYGRSEAWYYRAIGLARQAGAWELYVRAYLSHGTMMLRRGALPAARRSFLKALRRARRQSLRDGEALALHDLFALEGRSGNRKEALTYADQAVASYGPHHAGLPRLAHDIAYFWLEGGDHEHALPVFMATLGRVKADERPFVLGSVSRAAAGMEDIGAYEWARRELERYEPSPGVAEAWVDTARAALALNRLDEATEAAHLAESVARARREGQMRFLAESILEEIQEERNRRESEPRETAGEPSFASDQLARELLRNLQLSASAPSSEEAALATAGA